MTPLASPPDSPDNSLLTVCTPTNAGDASLEQYPLTDLSLLADLVVTSVPDIACQEAGASRTSRTRFGTCI